MCSFPASYRASRKNRKSLAPLLTIAISPNHHGISAFSKLNLTANPTKKAWSATDPSKNTDCPPDPKHPTTKPLSKCYPRSTRNLDPLASPYPSSTFS